MKLKCSRNKRIVFLLAIFILSGCTTVEEKEFKELKLNEFIKRDFEIFALKNKDIIRLALIKSNITPTNSWGHDPNSENEKDWFGAHVFKQTKMERRKNTCYADMHIMGIKDYYGVKMPITQIITFYYKNNKWHLVLANNYLFDHMNSIIPTEPLSPEFHVNIKNIFPDAIEFYENEGDPTADLKRLNRIGS